MQLVTTELSPKTCTQTDGCLHNYIEREIIGPRHSKNWDLCERLKLPQTMLHTEHKIKQGLTIVVALQLLTSSLHRANVHPGFNAVRLI